MFGLGAAASLIKRHHSCSFQVSVFGGCAGHIGQIPDGQCRVGGSFQHSTFNLDKHSGVLTDAHGRGCYLTSEANQLQCDEGKSGMSS